MANHQIRCLRPLLIEETVHFEQKFFMEKIAAGKVDITGAYAWFRRARSLPDMAPTESSPHSEGNTWDFINALVRFVLPSMASEMVPQTFLFDKERLTKLRSDILDLINLEICMCIYCNWLQDTCDTALEDTPTTSVVFSPPPHANDTVLSVPTVPEPHHSTAPKPKHILGDGHFATSIPPSPRSPSSSTASTPDTQSPTPLHLPFDRPASQVRTLLLTILSSSTINDTWTSHSPCLALQILHSTTTPLTHLQQIESHLTLHLSNPSSRVYQEAETRVLNQLGPVLKKLVIKYTPLTSLQIFGAATLPSTSPNQENRPNEEMSEIARRIAHIGILHWRVWAPLAYLLNPNTEEEIHIPKEQPKSTS